MSKNMTRKGLAFGAGFALVATGLAAMPAQAAPGDITLKPRVGENYSVFNGEVFQLDAVTSTLVNDGVFESLAYRIENPGQNTLAFDLPDVGVGADGNGVSIDGYSSIGTEGVNDTLDLGVDNEGGGNFDDAGDINGKFLVDFAANEITSLVIHTITPESADMDLNISVVRDESAADAEPNHDLTNDEYAALDLLDYSEGDAEITVQAYAEVDGDLKTVDPTYASDVETISFFDPQSVAMVPRIERFESTNDPRENDVDENVLAATLQFGKSLNLDMISLANFEFEVVVSDPDAGAGNPTELFYGRSANQTLVDFSVLPSFASGGDSDDADRLYFEFEGNDGAFENTHLTIDGTKGAENGNAVDFDMAAGNSYKFIVNRLENDTTATRDIASPAFAIPANTSTADGIEAAVVTEDVTGQEDVADTSFDIVPGTNAVTYTAQLTDDAAAGAGDAVKEASTPVLVSVKSTGYLSASGGYAVSGSPTKITELNQTVFTTGFTNSDGEYSVTVTSDAAAKSEEYVVTFHFLKDSTWTDATAYTATYDSGAPTTFETPVTVLGGENLSVAFTVEDQFGLATDVSGTKDLSVIMTASNTDNLEEIVAVDGGEATFTFDNYLAEGESDIITATLVTGTLTDNDQVLTPITLTLYNTGEVSAINVPETYQGAITHADFVDGKVSTTNPAPGTATAQIVGTAVDSNGSGIPGAAVTLSGDGMNFKQVGASTYFLDSINVVADAAGVFNVDVWTHTVTGATGADVTIVSGGQTETVEIESYLPAAMPGEVLDFDLVGLPAELEANKTYSIQASLMDKWGNPVDTNSDGGDGAVEIVGNGSVLINNIADGVSKNFGSEGLTTVFIRSVKDIEGPGSVTATLQADADYTAWDGTDVITTEDLLVAEEAVDDETTIWDETSFKPEIEVDVEVFEGAIPSDYGTLNAWTVNQDDGTAKVYVKFPTIGEKVRIGHQTGGSGSYETIYVKTLDSETHEDLTVNAEGSYIVRTIDLVDGTNRIRVTVGDSTEVQVRYNE